MPLTLPNSAPSQYTSSRQLIAGSDVNNLTAQLNTGSSGIVAFAGGGYANATRLTSHVNNIATVGTAADSVKLPQGFPGLEVWIRNAGANGAQVFTSRAGTINGTDSVATGVLQAAGANTALIYKCLAVSAAGAETWVSK